MEDLKQQDSKLASQLQHLDPYPKQAEQGLPWHVAMNIARWQLDQARRQRKQEADAAEAARKGLTLAKLKDQRRHEYQLRNCRSTIAEIVAAHPAKVQR